MLPEVDDELDTPDRRVVGEAGVVAEVDAALEDLLVGDVASVESQLVLGLTERVADSQAEARLSIIGRRVLGRTHCQLRFDSAPDSL